MYGQPCRKTAFSWHVKNTVHNDRDFTLYYTNCNTNTFKS